MACKPFRKDTLSNQEGTHLPRAGSKQRRNGIVGIIFIFLGDKQMTQFSRTELLIGKENIDRLKQTAIAVFGVGGVGSYVVEALARCGIGKLILIDHDEVNITNINRQIPALHSTIAKKKVDVMRERILDINPSCVVEAYDEYYQVGMGPNLIHQEYTYIVDAIDSLPEKIDLITYSLQNNIPIVSSMGTGNKLDPSKFTIADISKTHTCPMARKVRKLLRERGINRGLITVFSTEIPSRAIKSDVPASIAFVPAAAGLLLASLVVRNIIKLDNNPIS